MISISEWRAGQERAGKTQRTWPECRGFAVPGLIFRDPFYFRFEIMFREIEAVKGFDV